jgi:phosphoglycolate phosphatase
VRARFDLIAFDLDGTLVDSAPDLSHCLGVALSALERARPSLADTRAWIGDGIEMLLRRALEHSGPFTDRDYAIALERFDDCYRVNLFNRSRTYASVGMTLDALDHAGIALCCITNKRHEYATTMLELAELDQYFRFVYGDDSFPEKKPHPRPLIEAALQAGTKPTRCAFVGDSLQDCRAAAAAGFQFIWASYGYCASLEGVSEAENYERLDRFDKLIAAIGLPC